MSRLGVLGSTLSLGLAMASVFLAWVALNPDQRNEVRNILGLTSNTRSSSAESQCEPTNRAEIDRQILALAAHTEYDMANAVTSLPHKYVPGSNPRAMALCVDWKKPGELQNSPYAFVTSQLVAFSGGGIGSVKGDPVLNRDALIQRALDYCRHGSAKAPSCRCIPVFQDGVSMPEFADQWVHRNCGKT